MMMMMMMMMMMTMMWLMEGWVTLLHIAPAFAMFLSHMNIIRYAVMLLWASEPCMDPVYAFFNLEKYVNLLASLRNNYTRGDRTGAVD